MYTQNWKIKLKTVKFGPFGTVVCASLDKMYGGFWQTPVKLTSV
jgi:hypothetical protein